MTLKLNPFEFTIYSYLKENRGMSFSHIELAEKCGMNTRTALKYSESLVKKKLILKEKIREICLYTFD